MTFENIFVTVFVAAWVSCGAFAWLVFSAASRGKAGLGFLPISMAAGLVGGLSVPLLLRDDAWGIPLSVFAACALPAVLLGARKYSLFAASARPPVQPLSQENPE